MYLLDTNIISEPLKPDPHPAVLAWMAGIRVTHAFLSAMTLGEIRQGIAQHVAQHGGPTRRSAELEAWFSGELLPAFAGRLLPVGPEVASRWGQLTGVHRAAGRSLSVVDTLIAATALHHNLTLVTRNTAHMQGLGVTLINPWEQ